MVGDPASLPAVNSLLDAFPGVPATLWFETRHASDEELPVRLDPLCHELRRIPREGGGAGLVARVKAELPALADPRSYVWIACDTATTRALAGYARKELALPKERVHALGYWRAS